MSENIAVYVRAPELTLVELVERLSRHLDAPLQLKTQARNYENFDPGVEYGGRYDGYQLSVHEVPPPLAREDNPFLAEDDEDPYADAPQHRFDFEVTVWDLRFVDGGREEWIERTWDQLRGWLSEAGADELLMMSNYSEDLAAWLRPGDPSAAEHEPPASAELDAEADPVITVAAHELVYPDPEAELRLIDMLLPINIENIPTGRDNLGSSFDEARRWLGFRRALGRPIAELVESLELVVELGVALFRRARFRPDELVSLTIDGAELELPGAATHYSSAPRWASAVGAAMTLRDQAALDELCKFNVGDFGGSYDGYQDVYAEAVIAFVTGARDAESLFGKAAGLAADADVFPEWGRRVGVPTAEVGRAVARGDERAFNRHLAEGLEYYRTLHSRASDNHQGAAVVPLAYLGWAATAHERGLTCRVRSGYLLPSLVDGSFRGQD